MATRMERFDEFKALAESNIVERRDAAGVYSTLALATAVVRVGDILEEQVELTRELLVVATHEKEESDG